MKRITSILLITVVLLCALALPSTALAAENTEYDFANAIVLEPNVETPYYNSNFKYGDVVIYKATLPDYANYITLPNNYSNLSLEVFDENYFSITSSLTISHQTSFTNGYKSVERNGTQLFGANRIIYIAVKLNAPQTNPGGKLWDIKVGQPIMVSTSIISNTVSVPSVDANKWSTEMTVRFGALPTLKSNIRVFLNSNSSNRIGAFMIKSPNTANTWTEGSGFGPINYPNMNTISGNWKFKLYANQYTMGAHWLRLSFDYELGTKLDNI